MKPAAGSLAFTRCRANLMPGRLVVRARRHGEADVAKMVDIGPVSVSGSGVQVQALTLRGAVGLGGAPPA
jgi:hypothetical protein